MELFDKLLEVSRAFRIPYEYLGYETIQMGNVNHTYKVNFRLPDGKEKSFLVQNVNTYAFRNPVGLMNNIDSVTEHIRAKKPGQLALHFHHTADRKTYLADGENFWRMTNYVPSVTYNTVTDLNVVRSAGKADERAGQLVLQICRLGALSAHTRAAGAARAVRRLLALKTKHLVVHRKNPPHSVVLSIIG